MGLADELEQLAELHRGGALTLAEYEAAKQQLLGDGHASGRGDRNGSSRLRAGVVARPSSSGPPPSTPDASSESDDGESRSYRRFLKLGKHRRLVLGLGGALALLLVVGIVQAVTSGGGGGRGSKNMNTHGSEQVFCDAWLTDQGNWYSVPQSLLDATAQDTRKVDDGFGAWQSPIYGGENGWTYAANTPNGVAFWGVIGNTNGHDWYALNDVASTLSSTIGMPVEQPSSEVSSGLLDDQIRLTLTDCVGG